MEWLTYHLNYSIPKYEFTQEKGDKFGNLNIGKFEFEALLNIQEVKLVQPESNGHNL